MNKNILKLIAIFVMCFMICGVLVACAGETGPKGDKGEQGEQGLQGVQGEKGETGAQGDKGDKGDKGDAGEDGRGIASAVINENGELVLTYTNGDVVNLGKVTGDDAFVCEAHTWTEIKVSDLDGSHFALRACTACGWAEIACAHNKTTTTHTPATCVAPGFDTTTCDGCGEVLSVVETQGEPALGHDFPAFDEANLSDKWTLSINNSGLCDCEWEREYTAECERGCGEIDHKVGTAVGHVYGAWEPTIPTPGYNPCTWVPVEIRECIECKHETCFESQEIGSPKGHSWGPWTVTTAPAVGTAGEAVRVCNDCGLEHTEGVQKLVLPALDPASTDYVYTVETPDSCTTDGKANYVYTYTDGTTIKVDVVLPAHGHSVNDTCTYSVTTLPTAESEGVVAVSCAECATTLELAIPALDPKYIGKVYTIVYGNCVDPYDKYTIVLTDKDEAVSGAIVVNFAINGGYVHDEKPAKEDCHIAEGVDKIYYVYKCDKCGNWIVAYYEPKV